MVDTSDGPTSFSFHNDIDAGVARTTLEVKVGCGHRLVSHYLFKLCQDHATRRLSKLLVLLHDREKGCKEATSSASLQA